MRALEVVNRCRGAKTFQNARRPSMPTHVDSLDKDFCLHISDLMKECRLRLESKPCNYKAK